MTGLALLLAGSLLAADARSTVILRYACENELGRRDITLFANGTVRLREGHWEDQQLFLDELEPEELASALRRLASFDTRGHAFTDPGRPLAGEWIQTCEVELDLPDQDPLSYSFSGFDLPALVVTQLIQVAEDLAEGTRVPGSLQRLSPRYKPRPGDILQTLEGDRFKVLRFTVDGDGVELDGLDQPLRIYVALTDLHEAFASVVEADRDE